MNSPSVPSPTSVANAQTKSNIATATAQSNLNQVNQITPTGSLTYTQIGTNPDGTPKYQATTALNAQTQGLLNTGQQDTQKLLNQIGQGTDTGTLSQQTQDQLDQLGEARLDPELAKQQASLEQQLANQGIKPGSEAYNNAMLLNSQSANDARNQLILSGYTTANQAALNQANLPYSQLAALSGSAQAPSIGGAQTPQSSVNPTNTAGITQQAYQNALGQSNAFNSGLGSIAGTIGGWIFSDERLKTDIRDTGAKTPDGIPVKTFRFKGSPMMNLGVIAQDAEKKRPDAVAEIGGIKHVAYDKIGSPMLRLGRA